VTAELSSMSDKDFVLTHKKSTSKADVLSSNDGSSNNLLCHSITRELAEATVLCSGSSYNKLYRNNEIYHNCYEHIFLLTNVLLKGMRFSWQQRFKSRSSGLR
jgi:hypothetical protein